MLESTKEYTESTRPGTIYKVFEQHKKNELNHNGQLPIYIKPVVPVNPNKLKYAAHSNAL